MKLPEDKKERMKVLVLIGIGVVAVLVGLYFGITRLVGMKKGWQANIKTLEERIRKADLEIDPMSKDRKVNMEALLKIKDLSDKYVLKPRIGNNYDISAREFIDLDAQKVGMPIPPATLTISGASVGDVPGGGKGALVRTYTTRVTLTCSYNDVIRFIKQIQDSNPLVSVLNIAISGRGAKEVENHLVTFDVQWPIWADQEMAGRLDAQVRAGETSP